MNPTPEVTIFSMTEDAMINFLGSHPGVLLAFVFLMLALLALCVFYCIYAPVRVAYLEGRYPDATLRPPEVLGELAALKALERFFRWLLGVLPFVKSIPPLGTSSGEARRPL